MLSLLLQNIIGLSGGSDDCLMLHIGNFAHWFHTDLVNHTWDVFVFNEGKRCGERKPYLLKKCLQLAKQNCVMKSKKDKCN